MKMEMLLNNFHMSECKAMSTPLEHNAKLYSDDGTKEVDGTLHR
jgi:hypothetical protein